jgi:hypothetical protein
MFDLTIVETRCPARENSLQKRARRSKEAGKKIFRRASVRSWRIFRFSFPRSAWERTASRRSCVADWTPRDNVCHVQTRFTLW